MVTVENNQLRLVAGVELGIYQIEEVVKEIVATFQSLNKIEIDLSQTDKIDTTGFQFLISVKKSCELMGKEFVVTTPSNPVENFFDLYSSDFFNKKAEL